MARKSSGETNILRFTIKPVGPSRSEKEIRKDVADALAEALQNYRSQSKNKSVKAEAEPEGPFTGVEVVALWLLKTFVGGVVGGTGGVVGKEIYERFAVALKKRNLDPGSPTLVKQNEAQKKTEPKAIGKAPEKKS
jgi:hypothetical protein